MSNPHHASTTIVKKNKKKKIKGTHSRQTGCKVGIALFWQLQIISLTKSWGKLASAATEEI